MEKKQKRRWGDRRDGRLLRELDSMHFIMPIIYPNRCDNEAYISERIDLTNINEYLKKKNAGEEEFNCRRAGKDPDPAAQDEPLYLPEEHVPAQ